MSRTLLETILACAVSWVGNPLSMLLAIHRKPAGWWVVAGTQAAFVAFAVTSVDWRFGGQVLCLIMGCYGVYRWSLKRAHEPAIGQAVVPERPLLPPSPATAGQLQLPPSQPGFRPDFPSRPRIPKPVMPPTRNGSGPRPVARPAVNGQPPVSALATPAKTEAIVPRPRWEKNTGTAWERLVIAQDAIAALNHHDRQTAQTLQDRLETTRGN